MITAAGGLFSNGFQALEVFDLVAAGGNSDGAIDQRDAIWPDLLLWIDRNHDAISQHDEIARLSAAAVLSLGLTRVHDHSVDAASNAVMLTGSFTANTAKAKRTAKGKDVKEKESEERLLADISFAF